VEYSFARVVIYMIDMTAAALHFRASAERDRICVWCSVHTGVLYHGMHAACALPLHTGAALISSQAPKSDARCLSAHTLVVLM
jgi:hypothetical protein